MRQRPKRDTGGEILFRRHVSAGAMFTQPVHHEDPRTDHELAQAWLRSGSEAAARELVRRLHPRVDSIARGHLPSRESIEDLVQEAFIRAFQYLPRYDFRLPLEHWISRIVLNVCRNRFRHEASRPELRAASALSEDDVTRIVSQLRWQPNQASAPTWDEALWPLISRFALPTAAALLLLTTFLPAPKTPSPAESVDDLIAAAIALP